MRHNVLVRVPFKNTVSYSLYAQGLLLDIPNENEEKDCLEFRFLGGTVFALFYTFSNFRRAYLAVEWQNQDDGEPTTLPGIDVPLYVVFKAKGRKIDDLKHALYIMTKEDRYAPFRLSIDFWLKLSAQLEFYGSNKEDIYWLYNKYVKKEKKLV